MNATHSHVHPETGESIEFPIEMYHGTTGDQRTVGNPTDYVAAKFAGYSVMQRVQENRAARATKANATAASTPKEGAGKVSPSKSN